MSLVQSLHLVAIVGSMCSFSAVSLSRQLQPHRVPLVSGDSIFPVLGDASQFPSFLRTIVPDDFSRPATIITSFGWMRAKLITFDDAMLRDGTDRVENQLLRHGVSVTRIEGPIDTDLARATEFVRSSVSASDRVVVVSTFNASDPVLRAFETLPHLNPVFVKPFSNFKMETSSLSILGVDTAQGSSPDATDTFHRIMTSFSDINVTDWRAVVTAPELYDAAQLVVNAMVMAQRANQPLVGSDALLSHLRRSTLQGASGYIEFGTDTLTGNDPVPSNTTGRSVTYRHNALTRIVAALPSPGQELQLNQAIEWPGGATVAPVVCPRGAMGVLQPNQPWHRCVPCPVGSFSTELDSTSCTPCGVDATCPFASPLQFVGDEWRLERQANFPVAAQSLGTAAEREQLLTGVLGFVLGALVLSGGVGLASQLPALAPLKLRLVASLCKADQLFKASHPEPLFFPRTRYSTALGGVLTLVFGLCASGWVVYIVTVSANIDVVAVETYTTPGLLEFRPSPHGATVHLEVVAVAMDNKPPCSTLCSQPGLVVSDTQWELQCAEAPERGGCRLQGSPVVESGKLLPQAFSMLVRLPQTRVHSWQWRMTSRFRDDKGVVYSAGGNVSAPPGRVLVGSEPSVVAIELQPTDYGGDGGNAMGFVPHSRMAVEGSTVPTLSQREGERFEATLNVTAQSRATTDVFRERSLVEPFKILSQIVAVLGIMRKLCLAIFLVLRRLARTSASDSLRSREILATLDLSHGKEAEGQLVQDDDRAHHAVGNEEEQATPPLIPAHVDSEPPPLPVDAAAAAKVEVGEVATEEQEHHDDAVRAMPLVEDAQPTDEPIEMWTGQEQPAADTDGGPANTELIQCGESVFDEIGFIEGMGGEREDEDELIGSSIQDGANESRLEFRMDFSVAIDSDEESIPSPPSMELPPPPPRPGGNTSPDDSVLHWSALDDEDGTSVVLC